MGLLVGPLLVGLLVGTELVGPLVGTALVGTVLVPLVPVPDVWGVVPWKVGSAVVGGVVALYEGGDPVKDGSSVAGDPVEPPPPGLSRVWLDEGGAGSGLGDHGGVTTPAP